MSAKTNAARASHPSRIVRGLPGLLSRYAGEMLKVRQRSAAGVPLLPELVADHDFHHRSASHCGDQQPDPVQRQDEEEAAMPGQPARALVMSPAIATGSAAIIQQAQEALTFSLPTLCGRPELSAIGKPRLLVQKL